MKQKLIQYGIISVGVIFAVLGLNLFLVPAKIAAGGVSGLATIFYHLFSVPISISVIALNIPLFAFGLKLLGKSFAFRTLYATTLYSIAAALVPISEPNDLIISSVYGGVLVGIGIGLVVRSGGSTGGTDMAAKMLSERFKSVGLGTFVFGIDAVVIGISALVFAPDIALYAIASLYITTKVIDFFTIGLSASKAFYIISDKSGEIADAILDRMQRGVTSFTAKGRYSGRDKEVLLCVLQWRTEGAKLKRLVKSIDESAFVIVADVKEVLGEGF